MSPAIENPQKLETSVAVEQVLKTMFAKYQRVIIRQEFLRGLSGGRVLEVQPFKADGTPELPTVVKMATISLIQKEWQAYQQHIHRRLPYIAEIRSEPVLIPAIGWGGLRYTLMGGSTFEVVSLHDYCRRADVTPGEVNRVLERLLKIMRHIWSFNDTRPEFHLSLSYDHLLPVNLLVQHRALSAAEQPHLITPDTLPREPLKAGDPVRISGFALNKVNPDTKSMTLKRPQVAAHIPAYYLRYRSPLIEEMTRYQANQIIESIEGEVIETRASRLQDEIRRAFGEGFDANSQTIWLPPDGQISLPNPLTAVDSIVNQTRGVKIASVHGDFNCENILIEPETGMVSLIDFAEARQDHVLHDILRLETEVMTKLLPEILHQHNLPPAITLVSFYQQLHQAIFQPTLEHFVLPHPDLKRPLAMLMTIRQAARPYLLAEDDPAEYYQGLVLYLLGALKFKNLSDVPEHPLPKQVAFWGAAVAYQFLTAPADIPDVLPTISTKAELPHPYVSLTLNELYAGPEGRPPAPFQALHDVSQFVGRETELANLRELLTHTNGQNIYCLTGMGGIGKTALAVRLAHTLRDDFSDGVLWANTAASEPLAILNSWAQAFDYDFSGLPDLASRAAALRSALADKKVLIILDDVWNVDQIRPLLPSGSRSTVLLTTRDSDLVVALGGAEFQLSVLTAAESRQLLTEIVGDERVQAEAAYADEICHLLGNLPLAVKIAARRLASRRRWRLADLAKRLQDEKNRLAELSLRDREVRASFAVSWEALDKKLRRTFALLAVFEGRLFRVAALAAVAEVDRRTAEDQLASLVALSLASEEGERYYRQHPLLVDFAREHLEEDEAAYERMAQYYLAYASKHQSDYLELEQEWDNLLAGMRVAHQRSMWPLIINYADTLAGAWFARARFSDMRQGYQWACEAAQALEDHPAYASALCQWGRTCIEQGDYAEAEEHLTQSFQLYQELDDQPSIATALYYLARIAKEKANFNEAQRLLEVSRSIRERLDDMPGVAETLYLEADIPYANGDYEAAKRLGEQALNILQQLPDNELGSIRALGLLADVAIKQENYDLGEQYCQQALALCEEIQEQGEVAIILYILSEACRRRGDLASARDHAKNSLTLFTRMGDRKMQARTLLRLGLVHVDLNEYTLAKNEFLQSLNIHRELENTWSMIYTLFHLGNIHQALDQPDQAQKVWSEALELAEVLDHPLATPLREHLNATL